MWLGVRLLFWVDLYVKLLTHFHTDNRKRVIEPCAPIPDSPVQ